ncbi:LysE family translocator [Paracandidimonas soli]|uniref:Threonine/homoserine/homoserine lactone efflux protein n=1 Tax=Paracandidimonas soli TaxID=1917182 RepID=A0A4R3VBL1_9BURK|nr:LysE family translocator [Paracandidimonas soli]TCV02666.1 threonine/homoserine/homoserine lactone efflux protein [Paracandidimonas soli]
MLTTEIILSFYGIATLLALAPGPDNLFVLMQSALWGWRSGMIVILGLCTGVLGHTLLVAAGLAALLAASQTAFFVLKLIGAAYLLYLAWGAFRATPQRSAGQEPPRLSTGQLYRRGVIMSLSNPKLSLFFLAFLPQFASPSRGPIWPQILSLGLLFILASFLVFSLIAFFAGSIGERLQRSERAQWLLNRAAGTVFLGLALRLLTAQR